MSGNENVIVYKESGEVCVRVSVCQGSVEGRK